MNKPDHRFCKDIGLYRIPICRPHDLRCAAFKIKPIRPTRRRCPPDTGRQRRLFFCSFCGTRSASASRYGQVRFPAALGAACQASAGRTAPHRWRSAFPDTIALYRITAQTPPRPPLPESRSGGCRHSSGYRRASHPRRFLRCPRPAPCGRGKQCCGCAGQWSAARPQIRFRPYIRFGQRTQKRPLRGFCPNCYTSRRSAARAGTPQGWQRNRLRPSCGRTAVRPGYSASHISETPYDVRFIAVNDGVDSQRGDGEGFAAIRNLFNEWYPRDTSKKSVSAYISAAPAANTLASRPTATAATRTTRTSGFWMRKLHRLSSASLTSASTAKTRNRFPGSLNAIRFSRPKPCMPAARESRYQRIGMDGRINPSSGFWNGRNTPAVPATSRPIRIYGS